MLFRIFAATPPRTSTRGSFESFVRRARPAALSARPVRGAVGGDDAAGPRRRPGTAGPTNTASPARIRCAPSPRSRRSSSRFHAWLQWLADRQLGEAQARARGAGMRIGLYLDLAVGVAPDGSATWSDRALTVPGARIGAPPDYFNAAGPGLGPGAALAGRARRAQFRAVPHLARHRAPPRRRASASTMR